MVVQKLQITGATGSRNSKSRMELRLEPHLSPQTHDDIIEACIKNGLWPGLLRCPVTLINGDSIGLGVVAASELQQGQTVAHYPDTKYVFLEEYLKSTHEKGSLIPKYAQQVGTSGLAGWTDGPIVLLAHDLPGDQHYGHLINHSPCQRCRNVCHVVKVIAGQPRYLFRATRNIDIGEQLLRNYGDEYPWPNNVVECPACGKQKHKVSMSCAGACKILKMTKNWSHFSKLTYFTSPIFNH